MEKTKGKRRKKRLAVEDVLEQDYPDYETYSIAEALKLMSEARRNAAENPEEVKDMQRTQLIRMLTKHQIDGFKNKWGCWEVSKEQVLAYCDKYNSGEIQFRGAKRHNVLVGRRTYVVQYDGVPLGIYSKRSIAQDIHTGGNSTKWDKELGCWVLPEDSSLRIYGFYIDAVSQDEEQQEQEQEEQSDEDIDN